VGWINAAEHHHSQFQGQTAEVRLQQQQQQHQHRLGAVAIIFSLLQRSSSKCDAFLRTCVSATSMEYVQHIVKYFGFFSASKQPSKMRHLQTCRKCPTVEGKLFCTQVIIT
jgi:hypothetical protein